jgi:hypothetical protein
MNSDKAKVKYFSRQVWTGVIGLKARHESAFGSSGCWLHGMRKSSGSVPVGRLRGDGLAAREDVSLGAVQG